MRYDKDLIDRLRVYLGIASLTMSDAQVLSVTKGTLGRASIELRLALRDLWRTIALQVKRLR